MNRKRWMILAVCMLVLLSLAACGKADGGDDSGAAALKSTLQQVRDKLDEAKRDKAESDSTADDSVPEPEKTPEPAAAAEPEQSAVERIELTRVPSGVDEYAVITGYDAAENTVWSFETPRFGVTEMISVVELGQRGDRYYYVENTTVVCLDVQTGTRLWENSDYAGRATGFAFGDSALYLCGQYGPDFFAVSYTGETLARIEQFDPNYYWASEIELRGEQALVYLYGGTPNYDDPMIFCVDLHTYAVSSAADTAPAGQSFAEQYRAVLLTYPAEISGYKTKYTLYDIDQDGTPELIVHEDVSYYYIYSFDGEQVIPSEKFYWNYSNGLYAYDGNGLVVHDGGQGFMRFEYVEFYTMTGHQLEWSEELMSSENYTYSEIREYLDTLTPIDNFIPITDDSYLSNS
ncbi:MAG: hypothetical protein U0N32_02175 [Oscillospiraceae bacterium]